jgi:hypothetical protein
MAHPHPAIDFPAAADDLPRRLAVMDQLVSALGGWLTAAPVPAPSGLEDLSLRHLAKATGTTRSAMRLMRDGCWTDAGILIRAVFEQLFGYLWVVQDAGRAGIRTTMVTIKQEWANAKYLEGLAACAAPDAAEVLLAEADKYKRVADALLAELAERLGTTEKKVRDEAKLRVSAKAIEVNLGPRFSIPYAHYSGFVHSDGNALKAYGTETPAGTAYSITGDLPAGVPLASDLHHALLRMAEEVRVRCPRLDWPGADAFLAAQADWLAAADAARPNG